MKESITKFDLEAAFKALDEIDIPKTQGIKANRPALTEVFSRKTKFDALFEEYYDISNTADLTDAKDERDAEIAKAKLARIEKIVDLDADSPDQLLPSYVGKYIMQCPQCMTLFYKDQEDIEESNEDSTVVNVNEVCQHCGNDSGYTLIGKVGSADEEPMDLTDGEPEEFDVDAYDETEGEDLDIDVDDYSDDADIEDIDLDFEIEDDEEPTEETEETEEDTKEESFYIPANSTHLTEELEDSDNLLEASGSSDFNVSDEDFRKLISSSEFKIPISDAEVRGLLAMEESADTEAVDKEALAEGDLGLLGKTLAKKAKQIGKKIKDTSSTAIDKFANNIMTRAEKANWILQNALEPSVKQMEVDEEGNIIPNQKGKKFNMFLVIGYKNKYSNGKEITIAPDFDDKDLVLGMKEPQVRSRFEEAEELAQGWSQSEGRGPAFIYISKSKDDTKAVFLSEYFEGKLVKNEDTLDKLFDAVKKDLEGREKIKKSGGIEGETSEGGLKTKKTTASNVNKGDKLVFGDEIVEVIDVNKTSKFNPDVITLSIKLADGSTDVAGLNKNAEVVLVVAGTNEAFSNNIYLSHLMETLDDIHEKSVEKLITESLFYSYKNVAAFRLVECSYANNKLKVKGNVILTSGKAKKTTFTFTEAASITNNEFKLIGNNRSFGNNNKCEIICRTNNNTLVTESFKLNKK